MAALILLCLFIGLPIAEIWTFIEVGGRIGGLTTIAATIATALMGAALFRYQGLNTLARAQSSLQDGHMPLEEVVGGLGLLLAALCLFVPGFVTDTIGFLLFIPPLRLIVMGVLLRSVIQKAQVSMSTSGFGPRPGPHEGEGTTIDGEFHDVSEPKKDPSALPDRNMQDNSPIDGEKKP